MINKKAASKIVFCIAIALILSVSMIGVAYAAQNSNSGFSLWEWIKGLFGGKQITGYVPYCNCEFYPCGAGDPTCESECCGGGEGGCTDNDDDGYGVGDTSTCPGGAWADCNDNNPNIHPGATEICNSQDDDCDGEADEGDVCGCIPSTEVCDGIDNDCDGQIDEGVRMIFYRDADSDSYGNPSNIIQACSAPSGYVSDRLDCNDANAAIHPGATEICDEIDNNCDGSVDEGVKLTFYMDADFDSYGNPAITTQACSAPSGMYVSNSRDCDDANAAINPGATEVCDGVDNDCDYQIDEGVKSTFYDDYDGDNYGNHEISIELCTAGNGWVSDSRDCDDANAAIHPGATDIPCNGIDEDCLGMDNAGTDSDGDTYKIEGGLCGAIDCDDQNPNVYPGATEICDEIDNNCDGSVDEGVKLTFYMDADADSYGNPAETTQACSASSGYVSNSLDCNDNNAAINPEATEVCNGADDDCDGSVDEGGLCPTLTYYCDDDGDGYNDHISHGTCNRYNCIPYGCSAAQGSDCNDLNAAIHPGATEVCDGVDNDCDGNTDEGGVCPTITYYCDDDGDGYNDHSPHGTCNRYYCVPSGCSAAQGTDCNDVNAAIYPGATEVCNSFDDDCDGTIDEGCCVDSDGDGYNRTDGACGTVDCNDANAAINPGAIEICDEIDNDCDYQIDEGVKSTFYDDYDGDNYGNHEISIELCTAGNGWVSDSRDCDDANAAIHPGATEVCDGVDNDCDGNTDEGGVCPTTTYYCDSDSDSYIDVSPDGTCSSYNCMPSECSTAQGSDCNDANAAINPGAAEVCNNIDDDCDGSVDEGYVPTPTSCGVGACARTGQLLCQNGEIVDSCVPLMPSTEKCDSGMKDEDCDGSNNEDCACNEGQTQNCGPETDAGECVFGTQTCDIDGLWGDCIGAVYPTTEVCNGVDDNCNGAVDEGYVPTPTTCGVGACVASGELICSNGNETNTCTPGEPTSDANCNGIDENCNGINDDEYVETPTTCGVDLCVNNTGKVICVSGTTQEACMPLPVVTVYYDGDNDAYGNAANTQEVCTIPSGYILIDEDCNDGDATISPGGDDICDVNKNVIDKDCDATNNGELDCNDFCGDIDGDGYVTPEKYGEWGGVIPTIICPWIVDGGDCNDADAAVYPGVADAICNGVDDDCNGAIDEGYVPTPTSCGVGACARTGQLVCISGTVNNTCAPGTPAPETCNVKDDDCNGVVDDADADSDGMNDCNGDDKCPGSVADNTALNPNQYAQNNFATSAFESGPKGDQSLVYNMQNTKGCTYRQIVATLGIGIGSNKGCAPGVMQQWTGLSGEPDRVAGIGKK
jgi:hypothetical protein